jgi:hypothetical protein
MRPRCEFPIMSNMEQTELLMLLLFLVIRDTIGSGRIPMYQIR